MEDANQARNLSNASAHSEGGSPEEPSVQPPARAQKNAAELFSIDWNDAAKVTVVTAFNAVPYIGSILGGLVAIFWPPYERGYLGRD